MKNSLAVLGLASTAVLLFTVSAQAQSTYSGNQSLGFGGQIGNQTLTVSDDPTGLITFSFTSTGITDVGFFFSTGGTTGVTNTSLLTDTGSESLRTISGVGTSSGRSLLTFATGFRAGYAVSLGGDTGLGNLYSISTTGVLTLISSANEVRNGGATATTGYSFTLNATSLGLTAGSGAGLNFVASLGNANDGGTTNYYRSNEAFGPSDVSNQGSTGTNPGNTGSITFSGSDLYTLSVPEPTTWAMMIGGLGALVGIKFRQRRI